MALIAWLPGGTAYGQDRTDAASCGASLAVEQAMGSVAVTVQMVARGGAPPPPGMTPEEPPRTPAAGVPVQALAHAAPATVVATAVADAQGQTTLDLPPGRYWVVVPADGPLPGLPGAPVLATSVPDGPRVRAYQNVSVAADEIQVVTLGLTLMMP